MFVYYCTDVFACNSPNYDVSPLFWKRGPRYSGLHMMGVRLVWNSRKIDIPSRTCEIIIGTITSKHVGTIIDEHGLVY